MWYHGNGHLELHWYYHHYHCNDLNKTDRIFWRYLWISSYCLWYHDLVPMQWHSNIKKRNENRSIILDHWYGHLFVLGIQNLRDRRWYWKQRWLFILFIFLRLKLRLLLWASLTRCYLDRHHRRMRFSHESLLVLYLPHLLYPVCWQPRIDDASYGNARTIDEDVRE